MFPSQSQKMITVKEYIAQFGTEAYQGALKDASPALVPAVSNQKTIPTTNSDKEVKKMSTRELLKKACGNCPNCVKPSCGSCASCTANRVAGATKRCCYQKVRHCLSVPSCLVTQVCSNVPCAFWSDVLQHSRSSKITTIRGATGQSFLLFQSTRDEPCLPRSCFRFERRAKVQIIWELFL